MSQYQEGVIPEAYQRPYNSYFQEPPELQGLVSRGKLVEKLLPKEADIDNILKVIQRKVLKGIHQPVTVKEIQAGNLISPYFKVLYLLFKLVTIPEKEKVLLGIPETCASKIITL